MKAEEVFMREALAEAAKGLGLTAPNPAVGAVVVRNGVVAGRGHHPRAGEAHAEPRALQDAGEAARGADLYVTLEPCCTTGKTPPCTRAILEAGIRRVIVGCTDPNPAHAGRAYTLLREQGVEVVEDILRPECEHMIRAFARAQRTGLPFLSLKLAVSLDGRIADSEGVSQWITGPAARGRVQDLRREADAILAGTGTLLQDDPSLLPRPDQGRRPWRIVPDRLGRLPLHLRVFSDGHAERTCCILGSAAPENRLRELENLGVSCLMAPEQDGRLLWPDLFRMLAKRGINHILCEGGGKLAGALFHEGLVQELHWVQAPVLLGSAGRPAVDRQYPLAHAPRLRLQKEERLGDDLWRIFSV